MYAFIDLRLRQSNKVVIYQVAQSSNSPNAFLSEYS